MKKKEKDWKKEFIKKILNELGNCSSMTEMIQILDKLKKEYLNDF